MAERTGYRCVGECRNYPRTRTISVRGRPLREESPGIDRAPIAVGPAPLDSRRPEPCGVLLRVGPQPLESCRECTRGAREVVDESTGLAQLGPDSFRVRV